jgi:putative tryptophan/tyrosine transport system substrate-binding protein
MKVMRVLARGVHSALSVGYRQWRLATALLIICVVLTEGSASAPRSRPYRVGVLTSRQTFNPVLEGLREGLGQLGYHEGENVAFLVEDAQGEVANMAKPAAKLVEAKPDVMFTIATAPTAAAKRATTTLPFDFAVVTDPLRSGLIASYASSQNNLTGITNSAGPLSGKRLELLRGVAPGVKHVLVLVAPRESVAEVSFQFLIDLAPKLGIALLRRDVTGREEIERTLNALPKGAVDAIYHVPSILVGGPIDLLIGKSMEDKIPLSVHEDAMVEQGALVSYGANIRLIGMQAAKMMAKIFKGVKPADIPVQTPEKLALTINLTTARAIGLDIPQSVLERTDRLVE